MARLFDDALTQYLKVLSAVVTVPPFTMACWFRSDTIADDQTLMSIADKDAADFHSLIAGGNTGGDPIMAQSEVGGSKNSGVTTTGYSANTWHHACGVWAAVDSRSAYIDGGSKNTGAATRVVADVDCASIGYMADSTPTHKMSGRIAEVAIWNVALTDADLAVLARGYSPLFVRPASLVAYWPLIRDTDDDIVGGYSMTPFNGPTVAAHAPMIYPGRMLLGVPSAAPPAAALPVLSAGEGLHSLMFGGVTVR